MKRIATLILTIVTLTALGQIGSKIQQQSKVVGVWQNNQFGHQMILMLNADGKGDFDGEPVRYTAKDGKLSLTIIAQNETTIYSYALNGNALVVSGGDLEQPITFTKTSSQAATSTAAGPTSITTPANSAPSSTTLAAPATVAATTTTSTAQQQSALTPEQAILGTWTGNNESMEFRADGKCVCNGETIAYQVSKSNLVLNTAQGTEMMNYTINGNQLRTTVNGAQFVYTRVEQARPAGAKQGPRGVPSSNSRAIPQDLVGKWCWINVNSNSSFPSGNCIVLNGDGTYKYNSETPRAGSADAQTGGTASQASDQGKWWVEGDRIFYTSTTQGQGSYLLEKKNHPRNFGDPMIVLDGQSYLTSALRQPWK
jgi:hypothetical protein